MHDPDFRFVVEPKNSKSNYWLSTVALSAPSLSTRNRLLECANENGFLVRPAWNLLNKLPMYEHMPRAPLSVAERMSDALINLPSGSGLIMESEK